MDMEHKANCDDLFLRKPRREREEQGVGWDGMGGNPRIRKTLVIRWVVAVQASTVLLYFLTNILVSKY